MPRPSSPAITAKTSSASLPEESASSLKEVPSRLRPLDHDVF